MASFLAYLSGQLLCGACCVDCKTCSLYRKSRKQMSLPKLGSLHSSLSCSMYLVVILTEHACLHCTQVLTLCTAHIRTSAQYNAKKFLHFTTRVLKTCVKHIDCGRCCFFALYVIVCIVFLTFVAIIASMHCS